MTHPEYILNTISETLNIENNISDNIDRPNTPSSKIIRLIRTRLEEESKKSISDTWRPRSHRETDKEGKAKQRDGGTSTRTRWPTNGSWKMPLKRDYLPPFPFFPSRPCCWPCRQRGTFETNGPHVCSAGSSFFPLLSFFLSFRPSFLRLSPRWHVSVLVFVCTCHQKPLCVPHSLRRRSLSLSLSLSLLPLNVSPISVISGSQDSRSCETPLAAWFTRVTEYRTPRAVDVRRFTFSSAPKEVWEIANVWVCWRVTPAWDRATAPERS